MNFNTLEFFVFLTVFGLIYFPFSHIPLVRALLLLLGGLLFLGAASLEAALVFLGVTLASYLIARVIEKSDRKTLWLGVGVVVHCLAIAFFRWRRLAEGSVFPLGLSFYSFVCMGYLVELSRGKVARLSLREYLSALAFFPSVAAGPISALSDLSKKIANPDRFRFSSDFSEALVLIANGLMKKALAEFLWQASRGHPMLIEEAPTRMAWIKLGLFMARFYADFSGYSDIARGLALIFGVRLPENFLRPFFATTLSDYWNRWHVSLTTWIRAYVFLPILFALPRVGVVSTIRADKARASLATFFTMMIFALWHDLTTPFLFYGVFMGLLLAAELWWVPWKEEKIPSGVRRVILLFVIANGFVFYMFPDWPSVCRQFSSMYSLAGWGKGSIGFSYLILLLVSLPGIHLLDWWLARRHYFRDQLVSAMLFGIFVLGIHYFIMGLSGIPFVYFQF
jgi:alginate O-acetyltransferase complex protein AlgI